MENNASPVEYVNESVASRDFKYYIFDWDDNILRMPTKIIMERKGDDGQWRRVELSTSSFALVRTDTAHYRPPPGGWDEAFRNFTDDAPSGSFLDDTMAALARLSRGEKPSPSFATFRKTLIEGRLFAIVTARGHESETIKRAVHLFIENALSPLERQTMLSNLRGYRRWLDKAVAFGTDAEELDYYLGMCRYCAVTNVNFKRRMASDPIYGARLASAATPAKSALAKEFAIRDFVEHIFHMLRRVAASGAGRGAFDRPVAIGFSDDDKGNVEGVSNYIRSELAKRFPGIKFVVYDTSDRTLSKGRKVCVLGRADLFDC